MAHEGDTLEKVHGPSTKMELFVVYDVNHVSGIVFCARRVGSGIYTAFDVRDLPEAQTCKKRAGLHMEIRHDESGTRSLRCVRTYGPYSMHTLEAMFRFEDVAVKEVREVPNTRQGGRRFFAVCKSRESDKSVIVQETYFEHEQGLESLAYGATIRCLPLKPRPIDVVRGHWEYRGAFPVVLNL